MAKRPAPTSVLSLAHREAANWNKSLMQEFQAELERNPSADLMSMFHEPYLNAHRRAECNELSYAAKYNRTVLDDLYNDIKLDPEANLLYEFPRHYHRKIEMARGPKVPLPKKADSTPDEDYRVRLNPARTARIIFPLSTHVTAAIGEYSKEESWVVDSNESFSGESEQSSSDESIESSTESKSEGLAKALKRLLWNSPKLWEFYGRGVVVECCEGIIAKITNGSGRDTVEYTSMEFLAERAPEVPAPKVHGMILLGHYKVLFMTRVPGVTLEEVWNTLTYDGKCYIQKQLEDIFLQLRALKPERQEVGGVRGEGAREGRVNHYVLFKDIATPKEYSDLGFTAKCKHSDTYVQFLRSFLEKDDSLDQGLVFSHGDLRTANIMVQKKLDTDYYSISGIIDWEESGFYPAYYESTQLTRTFQGGAEEDWYSFLPKMISPPQYAVRWLVDRIWGTLVDKC